MNLAFWLRAMFFLGIKAMGLCFLFLDGDRQWGYPLRITAIVY